MKVYATNLEKNSAMENSRTPGMQMAFAKLVKKDSRTPLSPVVFGSSRMCTALASPLYVAPYLYTITRGNVLYCIEAQTGEITWLKRLTGVHSASPVYADGRIYVLSEDGMTLVLRPGEKYDEITRNGIDETCLASMTVSQRRFYIRSAEHLYCIGGSSNKSGTTAQ